LGGAAAIGITPFLTAPFEAGRLVGVVTTDPPLAEPVADGGDCELFSLMAFADDGVDTGVCWTEFFLEDFFDARVADAPIGRVLPLPRFRFLMTSVLSDSGRTTP
jgi:hypothetical protein